MPFARAAGEGLPGLIALGERLLEELRVAMFCSGCGDVTALHGLETQLRASAREERA